MNTLTPIQALNAIELASTANLRLGSLLDSAASAAGDRFLKRAPEFGENYVARTLEDFSSSTTAMQELVDALPADWYAAKQATEGLERLGEMQEIFTAGGVPFNFVDDVERMRSSLTNTVRSTAANVLRPATAH